VIQITVVRPEVSLTHDTALVQEKNEGGNLSFMKMPFQSIALSDYRTHCKGSQILLIEVNAIQRCARSKW
jgi:hypothetical protein